MLTPTLLSPSDLLHKLEREMWRAFHHSNHVHKADHFYNFCVTSLAMKDHFFEWKGISPTKNEEAQRKPYYDFWNAIPELLAASEIANSMKHFVLRHPNGNQKATKTKLVRRSRTSVTHAYVSNAGSIKIVRDRNAPSITLEFEGGEKFKLYEFMDTVVRQWQNFLLAEGVPIKKQKTFHLYGTTTGRRQEPLS